MTMKLSQKWFDFRCAKVQYYTKEVNINALPWIVDINYQIPKQSLQSYNPPPTKPYSSEFNSYSVKWITRVCKTSLNIAYFGFVNQAKVWNYHFYDVGQKKQIPQNVFN